MASLVSADVDYPAYCPKLSGVFTPESIAAFVAAAQASAEGYCGRVFSSDTRTEYYDGNGYPELPLTNRPVTAIGTVSLDILGGYGQTPGTFGPSTVLNQGTDFVWVPGKDVLQLLSGRLNWPLGFGASSGTAWGYPGLMRRGTAWLGWPKIPGCVQVVYTAGYTASTVPADLKAAICAMASWLALTGDNGGMVNTSESYIDTSVGKEFIMEALARGNTPALASSRMTLDRYREPRLNRGIY